MDEVENEIPQFAVLMRNDAFGLLFSSFLRMHESLFYSPFIDEKKGAKNSWVHQEVSPP